jgi:hypothetical protein
MGDDGLKEDIGEAVPLSTTARLLTSKRGADPSLECNVLLGIHVNWEGQTLQKIQQRRDRTWSGMV